jgi:uncharacterized protein
MTPRPTRTALDRVTGADLAPPLTATDPDRSMPRLLRTPVARVVTMIAGIAVMVLAGSGASNLASVSDEGAGSLVGPLVGSAVVVVCYLVFVRATERRRVVELDPRAAVRELPRGLALGALLFAVTIALVALAGGYSVDGFSGWSGVLPLLGAAVGASVVEEVMFRGLLLRIVEELAGTTIALMASALFFGAIHLLNPRATVWGGLAIAVEAGALLGLVYVTTRSLWTAMGVHVAWNFVQGGVFGVTISGSVSGGGGILDGAVSGPQWVSGGQFGPEASVFAVVVCLVAAAAYLRVARRSGQWRRPLWRERPDVGG